MKPICKIKKYRGSFNVVREDNGTLVTGGYGDEETARCAARRIGYPVRMDEDTFRDEVRKVVLDALDAHAQLLTGDRENGPKDAELAELFKGVDAIAARLFKLYLP